MASTPHAETEKGSHSDQLRVVIVGGGVAALETALALADLGRDRTDVTVIAPNTEFVYRPMVVREPFAHGAARRYPLAPIVRDAGATLLQGELGWIDPVGQTDPHEGRRGDRVRRAPPRAWREHQQALQARLDDRRPRSGRDHARADPGCRGRFHPQAGVRRARPHGLAAAVVRARADDSRTRLRHGYRSEDDDRHPRGQPTRDLWRVGEQFHRRAPRSREHHDDHLRIRRGSRRPRGRDQPR